MSVSGAKKLKDLGSENATIMRIVAEQLSAIGGLNGDRRKSW